MIVMVLVRTAYLIAVFRPPSCRWCCSSVFCCHYQTKKKSSVVEERIQLFFIPSAPLAHNKKHPVNITPQNQLSRGIAVLFFLDGLRQTRLHVCSTAITVRNGVNVCSLMYADT